MWKKFLRWLLRDYKVINQESSTKTENLFSMDFLWMCNSMAVKANTTQCLVVPFSNSGLTIPGPCTETTDTSLHRNKMQVVLRTVSALSQCVLNKLYRVLPNSYCFLEACCPGCDSLLNLSSAATMMWLYLAIRLGNVSLSVTELQWILSNMTDFWCYCLCLRLWDIMYFNRNFGKDRFQ